MKVKIQKKNKTCFYHVKLIFFLLVLAIIYCRCETKRSETTIIYLTPFVEKFANKIKIILATDSSTVDTSTEQRKYFDDDIRTIYAKNEFRPFWISDSGKILEKTEKFITELEQAKWDGIDPEQFDHSQIKKMIVSFKLHSNSVDSAISLDTCLTNCYLAVVHTLLLGEVLPQLADPTWFHPNDTVFETFLNKKGDIRFNGELVKFRSKLVTYSLLREEYKRYFELRSDSALAVAKDQLAFYISKLNSKKNDSTLTAISIGIISRELPWLLKKKDSIVERQDTADSLNRDKMKDNLYVIDATEEQRLIKGYQYYHSLAQSGNFDRTMLFLLAKPIDSTLCQIRVNMERIRWLPQELGNEYILINIPAMELYFNLNGSDTLRMNVIVGQPHRSTPTIFAFMKNIIINPTWGVPLTILDQDVLPGLIKSGRKYLSKRGLKAYDRKGKLVNIDAINARNYRRYIFRQDPGEKNALGFVKFNLSDPFDIYMHDTPHRSDFARNFRALSSGCIRLEHPRELAIFILSQLEKLKFDEDILAKKITKQRTESIVLKYKIPVHIVYLTAFEDSSKQHIRFFPDIYHKDDTLVKMLTQEWNEHKEPKLTN